MKLSKSSNIASSIILTATLLSACGGGGGDGTSTPETTPSPTPSGSSTPSPSGASSPTPTPPGAPVPIPTPGVTITLTPSSPPGVGVVTGRFTDVSGDFHYHTCVKDNVTGLTWNTILDSGTNYDSLVNRQTYIPPVTTFGAESYGYATQSQIDDENNVKSKTNRRNTNAMCGYTNWRLPTVTELRTLYKGDSPTCKWVDCSIFAEYAIVWTSTNAPPDPWWPERAHFAQSVDFRISSTYRDDGRWNQNRIMWVRN